MEKGPEVNLIGRRKDGDTTGDNVPKLTLLEQEKKGL